MTSNFSFQQDFDSDDEDQATFKQSGRDATIIVIDCNNSMFDELQDDESSSLFTKCLSVLERYLLNKIISSNKDLVSIHGAPGGWRRSLMPHWIHEPMFLHVNLLLARCPALQCRQITGTTRQATNGIASGRTIELRHSRSHDAS